MQRRARPRLQRRRQGRRAITFGETRAYVTSPATGEVLGVTLTDLSVQARMTVGGRPALVAVITASGEQQ